MAWYDSFLNTDEEKKEVKQTSWFGWGDTVEKEEDEEEDEEDDTNKESEHPNELERLPVEITQKALEKIYEDNPDLKAILEPYKVKELKFNYIKHLPIPHDYREQQENYDKFKHKKSPFDVYRLLQYINTNGNLRYIDITYSLNKETYELKSLSRAYLIYGIEENTAGAFGRGNDIQSFPSDKIIADLMAASIYMFKYNVFMEYIGQVTLGDMDGLVLCIVNLTSMTKPVKSIVAHSPTDYV
jgi:hypothetical protein